MEPVVGFPVAEPSHEFKHPSLQVLLQEPEQSFAQLEHTLLSELSAHVELQSEQPPPEEY